MSLSAWFSVNPVEHKVRNISLRATDASWSGDWFSSSAIGSHHSADANTSSVIRLLR